MTMYCRKCGKALTDDASRKRGYGPKCWKNINNNDPNQTYFNFQLVEKKDEDESEDPSPIKD